MFNLEEEEINEQIDWLKKTFTNQCLFCGNEIETVSKKEEDKFHPLPLCEFCLNKLELHKTFLAYSKHYGIEHKLIKLVKEWFDNRCYFCENELSEKQKETQEKNILFSLCNVSCLQRYKIITNWGKGKNWH